MVTTQSNKKRPKATQWKLQTTGGLVQTTLSQHCDNVVESNVHFPTDYNLLWDSARKCLDIVDKFLEKYSCITDWRKKAEWYRQLKNLMRAVGKASSSGGKGKEERIKLAAKHYLTKAQALQHKL